LKARPALEFEKASHPRVPTSNACRTFDPPNPLFRDMLFPFPATFVSFNPWRLAGMEVFPAFLPAQIQPFLFLSGCLVVPSGNMPLSPPPFPWAALAYFQFSHYSALEGFDSQVAFPRFSGPISCAFFPTITPQATLPFFFSFLPYVPISLFPLKFGGSLFSFPPIIPISDPPSFQ